MSSGFITETEAAEARKKRQEEWEKVRKPDEPVERPEEPYDSRSLYERLKEQKMKKDLEYEEAHKLKNLIRGLDDDEVQFLDLVDRTKMKAEKEQLIEERKELQDFRQRVATLQENAIDEKIQSEKITSKPKIQHNTTRPSQKSILVGAVKRKNGEIDSPQNPKKATIIPTETNNLDIGALKCLAILPGIGKYKESSDSEISTDSEEEPDVCGQYDLVGRKSCKNKRKCDSSD